MEDRHNTTFSKISLQVQKLFQISMNFEPRNFKKTFKTATILTPLSFRMSPGEPSRDWLVEVLPSGRARLSSCCHSFAGAREGDEHKPVKLREPGTLRAVSETRTKSELSRHVGKVPVRASGARGFGGARRERTPSPV